MTAALLRPQGFPQHAESALLMPMHSLPGRQHTDCTSVCSAHVHVCGGVEHRAGAQEEQDADEGVVQEADVEEHLAQAAAQ